MICLNTRLNVLFVKIFLSTHYRISFFINRSLFKLKNISIFTKTENCLFINIYLWFNFKFTQGLMFYKKSLMFELINIFLFMIITLDSIKTEKTLFRNISSWFSLKIMMGKNNLK